MCDSLQMVSALSVPTLISDAPAPPTSLSVGDEGLCLRATEAEKQGLQVTPAALAQIPKPPPPIPPNPVPGPCNVQLAFR